MFLTNFLMVRGGPYKRHVKKGKILALAKGFRGRRKNCYKLARIAVKKELMYQYISRRLKKRDLRKLRILRINLGAREHNTTYSVLTRELQQSNILLNRKVLSELAIHEPRTFQSLAELAKKRESDGLLAALD